MRNIYHLCWASHEEAMCRSEADLIRMFNTLAEAVIETESRLLADSEMTTHCHLILGCDSWKDVVSRFRYKYCRYFNSKYERVGKLGEKNIYSLELDGNKHIQTALSYVFRQGLHHGLASTPFGYRFNSVNCIFRKALGKENVVIEMDDWKRFQYLSRHNIIGKRIRMKYDGELVREDVIDTRFVEELYVTPKNFLFQMIRKSDSDWENEQKDERSKSEIITLKNIEPNRYSKEISQLLSDEFGREDRGRMTDLELCQLVDCALAKKYIRRESNNNLTSIYQVPIQKRKDIANEVWELSKMKRIKYVSEEQIRRCILL